MSRDRNSAEQKEPETKSAIEAKAHDKAREQARGLQRAVARLLYQSLEQAEAREGKFSVIQEQKDAKQRNVDAAADSQRQQQERDRQAEEQAARERSARAGVVPAEGEVEMHDLASPPASAPAASPAPQGDQKAAAVSSPKDPPIYTPLTMYGYDSPTGGGLKKFIGGLSSLAAEVKSGPLGNPAPQPEPVARDGGARGLDNKHSEPSAAPPLDQKQAPLFLVNQLVKQLEDEVRNIQDGWMMGEQVDPEVLKDKAKKLAQELTRLEEKAKAPFTEPDKQKLQRIKQYLDDFPAKVDMEVANLQRMAQERVASNLSADMHQQILTADVLYSRLSAAPSELGRCDFQSMNEETFEQFRLDPQTNQALLSGPSNRAYILAYGANNQPTGLLYIDKSIDPPNVQKLRVTSELLDALERGASSSRIVRGAMRLYGSAVITPPAEDARTLTAREESMLRKAVGHSAAEVQAAAMEKKALEDLKASWHESKVVNNTEVDWKKTLPREQGDAAELDLREQEEEKCIAECGGNETLGREMARDKAIERLMANRDKDMVRYETGNDTFTIIRKRDKDDRDKVMFSVVYTGKDPGTDNPQAMAAAIDLCYRFDPTKPIRLSCAPIDSPYEFVQEYAAKRVAAQLEAAVIHAEKCSSKGIHMSLELDANTQAALDMTGDKAGVRRRIAALNQEWEKHVKKKDDKAAEKAMSQFAPSKEGELGALLAASPPNSKSELGRPGEAELAAAFKTKANGQRKAELTTELSKLEIAAKLLGAESDSIRDQLAQLTKELEKPEVQESSQKLAEITRKLEGLEAAQKVINERLEKMVGASGAISDSKPNLPGTARNYYQWLDSRTDAIKAVTGLDDGGCNTLKEGVKRTRDLAVRQLELNRQKGAGLNKIDQLKTQLQTLRTAAEQKAFPDEAKAQAVAAPGAQESPDPAAARSSAAPSRPGSLRT